MSSYPVPMRGSEVFGHVPEIRVLLYVHPFRDDDIVESSAPAGYTLLDIIGDAPADRVGIWVDGNLIDHAVWKWYRPSAGSTVTIRAIPQGDDFLRTVLQIGIIVFATWAAGPAGLGLGELAGAAFIGGVTLAGNLLLNALIPPAKPQPAAPEEDFSRLASFTGVQNVIGRFIPIPRLLGRMRYYPPIPMTGTPFTYLVGDLQFMKALFILGYGPLSINGVRVDNSGVKTHITDPGLLDAIFIGDTALSNFPGVRVEVGDPAQMTIFSQTIHEERVAVSFDSATQAPGQTVTDNVVNIRTTQPDTDEITVDFEFPNGLFSLGDDGSNRDAEVSWTVEYRRAGTEDPWILVDWRIWDPVYSEAESGVTPYVLAASGTTFVVRGRTRQTVRRGVRFPVTTGQYDVRVTRTQTYNQGSFIGSTNAIWLNLKSTTKDRPFDVDNVVGLAIDIMATDTLSGTLDNVSVLAQSILPVWNGSVWSEEATSNPAWCFVEALCGVATRRPLDRDADLDRAGLLAWANAADAAGFEFNMVVEGQTNVLDLIRIITAAGRASWAVRNNLIGVVREEEEQTPKQMFTPRNATNFKLKKFFPRTPHALRVQFVDGDTYEDTERIVYDDGYNSANATLFETIQLPGVTSADQAWKLGRFHLAQMRLRPEQWTFDAYVDTLIAQRGDAIVINNDAFLDGLKTGRVTAVTVGGAGVTQLTVDETLFMDPQGSYKVSVRYIDSEGNPAIATRDIQTVSPSTKVVTPTTPFPAEVAAGDLFTFGTSPSTDAKIIRITPADDLMATITAVPLAPALLTADQGIIPPYAPVLDQPVDHNRLPPPVPQIVRIRSDETTLFRDADGSLRTQMVVDFLFPPGQPGISVEMRFAQVGFSYQWLREEVSSDAQRVTTTRVSEGETYRVQLRARNQRGVVSAWSPEVQHLVVGKTSPPSDVTGFSATVQPFGIQLTWNDIADLDRDEFEIRQGTVWEAATLFWRGAGTLLRTNVLTAGTYNFLIKAIDTSGNYSVTAALATATITSPGVSDVQLQFANADMILSWTPVLGSFPIAEYEIRHGGSDFATATFVARVRTTAYRQRVDWSGARTWRVAAVDVAGNIGVAGSVVASVTLPTVQSVNPQVIDNTVLLRWVPIQGTLPIERYRVLKGATFAMAEVIGVSDTTFSAIVESAAGIYTYWVLAIDSAGNEGPPQSVQTTVNEPPDFQLNDRFISDGFGSRTSVQRISEDRRSVKFNGPGNDQFISLPNTLLDGETDCTIEVAVAFDAAPTTNPFCVFAAWNGAGAQSGDKMVFQFEAPNFTDNTITISFYPYNQVTRLEWVISGVNLYDGRFRMYSIRRNQTSGNVELFINGVSQGTRAGTLVTLDVAPNWFIFGSNIDGNSATRLVVQTMNGRIDEIRVWRDLRTPTEILNYWNRELDLNEDNLAGYYRFNLQGSGVTADDDSPADNNGTINGASQNLPVPTLLVPFPASETVQDKLSIHGYATPQAQITAGYDYVCQPVPLTASFEEVYNTGVVLAASRLQVLLDLTNVVGTVTAQVTISTKEQIGDPWNDFTPGETDVFATNFQFVKIHIDFTVGNDSHFATLGQITTDGFVKRKTDEGTAVISVNPTTIQFNVQFIDVESIVVTALGTTFALPVVDFTDVPFPTEFDVYLFDAAGNQITGRTVKWVARGA